LSEADEKASNIMRSIELLIRKHPTAVGLVIVAVVVIVAGLTIYVYLRSGKKQEAKTE